MINIFEDNIKKIDGFKDYYVSTEGNVISTKRKEAKILSTFVDNVGYKQVILQDKGKKYYKRVHRLVAETFLKKR